MEEEKLSLTAGIGNSYVDSVNTIVAAIDQVKQLDDAKREIEQAKQDYNDGKISYDAYQDTVTNGTILIANLASTLPGAANAAKGLATAAPTAGFYATAGIQVEKTTSKEKSTSYQGVGSNFNADSIIIYAGGDATIQGNFLAKDMSLNGNNITIKAIDSWGNETKYQNANIRAL